VLSPRYPGFGYYVLPEAFLRKAQGTATARPAAQVKVLLPAVVFLAICFATVFGGFVGAATMYFFI